MSFLERQSACFRWDGMEKGGIGADRTEWVWNGREWDKWGALRIEKFRIPRHAIIRSLQFLTDIGRDSWEKSGSNGQNSAFFLEKSSQNLIIPWKHCIHGHFRQVKTISFTTILLLLSEPWHAERPRNAKIRIQHPSIGASAPWPYNWIQTGHLPGQRHG